MLLQTDIKDIIIHRDRTVILKKNGEAYISGKNNFWQFGINDNDNRCLFTKIPIDNIDEIQMFDKHTILRQSNGTIWGSGLSTNLQFGSHSKLSHYQFKKLGLSGIKKIFANEDSTFVIAEDDVIIASGNNRRGQLGLGGHLEVYDQEEFSVSSLTLAKEIITEKDCDFTFAITEDNDLYATGGNEFGQLGVGDNSDRYAFKKVFENVKKILIRKDFALLQTHNDEIFFAGNNTRLNLNLNTNKKIVFEFTKVDLGHIGLIKDIFITENIVIVQTYTNQLYGCGTDIYNQITKEKLNIKEFTKISFSNNIDKVIVSEENIFILNNKHKVYVCGFFLHRDIGEFFEEVADNVRDIYTNYQKVYLLDLNDNLLAFGNNRFGDLGVGSHNPYINKPILINTI